MLERIKSYKYLFCVISKFAGGRMKWKNAYTKDLNVFISAKKGKGGGRGGQPS